MYKFLFILLLSSSVLLAQKETNIISVSGTATKEVKADQLILSMGIALEGTDAQEIFDRSAGIYNKGLEVLRKRKKQCSFTTDIVRLSALYKRPEQAEQKFKTNQSLQISITDLNAYGEIVNELLALGFNEIRNTRFAYSKPEELKKEVLVMAIEAGKEKAQTVAKTLEVNTGRVISFSETNYSSYSPSHANVVSRYYDEGTNTMNVEAAMVNVTVSVNMSFSIDYTPTSKQHSPEK